MMNQMQPYQQIPAATPMQQPSMQYQYGSNGQFAANGVRWVDGVAEIRSMVVPAGIPFMFMDRMKPVLYVAIADRNGVTNVTEYVMTQQDAGSVQQYVTVDQLNNAIKEMEERYAAVRKPIESYDEPKPAHAAAATATATAAAVDEPVHAAAQRNAIRGKYAQSRSNVANAAGTSADAAASGTILQ